MTKETIIDGVNVSECGFFHPEYDTDCHIALAFSDQYEGCMKCENNPNCYFKQLKRPVVCRRQPLLYRLLLVRL